MKLIPGPALVEEPPPTTLVLPDQNFARDEPGQLIISDDAFSLS